MKKCQKCGKAYDDSWGVCLSCSEPLSEMTAEECKVWQASEVRKEEINLRQLGRLYFWLMFVNQWYYPVLLVWLTWVTAVRCFWFGLPKWSYEAIMMFLLLFCLVMIISRYLLRDQIRTMLNINYKDTGWPGGDKTTIVLEAAKQALQRAKASNQ